MKYLSTNPLFYKGFDQEVSVISPKYSLRVGIHGGYIAVTVMSYSFLGILGMWKPMTQGGQVLILDEILGNICKFIPCVR